MSTPPPPLDGVKIVDLTSYIAGSYAAMQLADLGAAVIKVEALEGDSFRELPGFFGWNRGKRSLAVNLKTPEGRQIVHQLAERSDVVMENMRPGVAERLGVGYDRLSVINPRLIYSSVTAFGSICGGSQFDNTLYLGIDWFSIGPTRSTIPVTETTWGKIKSLYNH